MKIIKFNIDGREASLIGEKYSSEINDALSYGSPSARYVPRYNQWLQEKKLGIPEDQRQGWDGKIQMMKGNKVPIGLLLGAKDDLAKAGLQVEIKEWTHKPKVERQKGFYQKDVKYHYQNDAVDKMLSSIDVGGGLVLAATGAGKTATAAMFFSHLKCNCLFVVDTIDLLYQSQKEIQEWLYKNDYDKRVGVVGNSKFDVHRVTVATIQTLHKHAKKKAVRDWLRTIDVILIDEIHTQMNRRNFAVVNIAKPQVVIGLTATMQLKRKPVRFKCYAICGPTIFEYPLEKGIEAGVLSQGVVVQVPVAENMEEVKLVRKIKGKWVADDYVHEVVDNNNLHQMTVNLVKACLAQDLCVVVLVDRIKHLKKLKSRLAKYDPKIFYGAVAVSDRKKQLKTFDKGKDNLIIANRVFEKGINLKRIDVIIDCAQRSSRNNCVQKFGRAVRLHTEKAGVYYFDFFTEGKLEKAAKARRGAFKKAKIPIIVTESNMDSIALIREADKLLTAALKKTRDKTAQGELFQ